MRVLLIVAALLLTGPHHAVAQDAAGVAAETAERDAYAMWRDANRLRNLGGADNLERALEIFRQATERYLREEGEDGELLPYYRAEVAATATMLERSDEAREARLAQIADLRRLDGDPMALADAFDRLAWLELARGAHAEAIDAMREARAIYENLPDLADSSRLRLAGGFLD